MKQSDTLKHLLDCFCTLECSAENKRRRSMWREVAPCGRDQFRPTPHFDSSWRTGKIPITADIQNPTWAKLIGFDLPKFYLDPSVFLENYLKIMMYRFEHFEDDTFLERRIPLWGTSGMEGSLFGMEVLYSQEVDPQLSATPLIADVEDLPAFTDTIPSFYEAGMMPALIRMYEGVQELLGDDFCVYFPQWNRSIFGIATYLRGYENFLVDTLAEPEAAAALLRHLTDCRKAWFCELAKYLGTSIEKGSLYNDEINCPTVSPSYYQEAILPLEQELSAFHGGIYYWHSCGDVSRLIPDIARIPGLELFNCGPWTSIADAANTFRGVCPIEICMNPQADILEGTPLTMQKKLTHILQTCASANIEGFGLKISALNMQVSMEHTLRQIQCWLTAAHAMRENAQALMAGADS